MPLGAITSYRTIGFVKHVAFICIKELSDFRNVRESSRYGDKSKLRGQSFRARHCVAFQCSVFKTSANVLDIFKPPRTYLDLSMPSFEKSILDAACWITFMRATILSRQHPRLSSAIRWTSSTKKSFTDASR